jgi:hypothetical protein
MPTFVYYMRGPRERSVTVKESAEDATKRLNETLAADNTEFVMFTGAEGGGVSLKASEVTRIVERPEEAG